MSVYLRKDNEWKKISNPTSIPLGINFIVNSYDNSQRTNNELYVNDSGRLLYVSAVLGFERDAEPAALDTQVSGSYVIATLYSPDEDPNIDSGIEVSRIRDNGRLETQFLFLNCKFIVPSGYSYRVTTYLFNNNPWHLESGFETKVSNQAWIEINFTPF